MTWRRSLLWCLSLAAACAEGGKGGDDDDEAAVPAPPPRVQEDESGRALVVLDSAELVRIDVALGAVRAVTMRAERELPGEVREDPERVAVLRAPVAGRLEAGAAGWPRLQARVAAGSEVAVVADARPLAAPMAGRVTELFVRPGEFVQAGQPLLELTDDAGALVAMPWEGPGAPPAAALVLAPTAGAPVSAAYAGAADSADALTGRPLFLYRAARGWPGARPGARVRLRVADGDATDALALPAGAVVQWEGLPWAFVRRAAGRFERVALPGLEAQGDGWRVPTGAPGLAAGDSVVTRGAMALLSEEFRSRVTVGEESGE